MSNGRDKDTGDHNPGVLVIITGGNVCLFAKKRTPTSPIRTLSARISEIRKIVFGGFDEPVLKYREGNLRGEHIRVEFEDLRDPLLPPEKLDSAQVNPKIWAEIAKVIQKNYMNYEGFVILHGLDTMAYTASALSLMLGNLQVPVVVTGSQRPLNFTRTDAVQNIRTAMAFAGAKTLGIKPVIPEVTVYSYDTLFRGNRISMIHASSYQAFDSPNYPALAVAGERIEIQSDLIQKIGETPRLSASLNTHAKVEIIDVFPGMPASAIEGLSAEDPDILFLEKLKEAAVEEGGKEKTRALSVLNPILESLRKKPGKEGRFERLALLLPDNKRESTLEILTKLNEKLENGDRIRGVLLRTYGMGTAPTNPRVLRALSKLVASGVIVLNVTQAHSGRISHGADPVSLRLFEQGVISGVDMTAETAYAKMVILLSNAKNQEDVGDELQLNVCGEQSQSIFNFHFEGDATIDKPELETSMAILRTKKVVKRHELNRVRKNQIRHIQLRILGVKPDTGAKKGKIATLQAYLVDREEEVTSPDQTGQEIIATLVEGDTLRWSSEETINIAYDITSQQDHVLSPENVLRIDTNEPIRWKSVSVLVFVNVREGD